MDISLFSRLLNILLKAPVSVISNTDEDLKKFEKNFCFESNLTPMLTKEILQNILNDAQTNYIYEIADDIGVYIALFKLEDNFFIIGPYIRNELKEKELEAILFDNHLPISYSRSLNLYLSNLPIVYTGQLSYTINSCITAFCPMLSEFTHVRLEPKIERKESKPNLTPNKNYSDIYRRYDEERAFQNHIRMGDVENVLVSYQGMINGARGILSGASSYISPTVSFAILKTIARKAAESSGLSVITIDEITGRYARLSDTLTKIDEQEKCSRDMILELTKAVREHQLKYSDYSAEIVKTLDFIITHLSEEIRLDDLAKNVLLSISSLCSKFKKETGLTVKEYIAAERCKKAALLLAETNHPIQAIGSFVGYDDNNYFVKVFKKVYGQTPSEYRGKIKN
jgi:AraC-like DNA-binding protein